MKQRNHTIDVLKGICILLVIIQHYEWTNAEELRYLFPFWVKMQVPVFMIISGYVYTKSFEKRGITQFEEAYGLKNIYGKIVRYTVPFIVAFLFEEFYYYLGEGHKFRITQVTYRFMRGGWGPGSYYYPLLIQLIFVFPVIYFIIKKYDFKGLVGCLLANLIYEILQRSYNLSAGSYRLLIFRFLFVIAFGSYLVLGKRPIKKREYGVLFVIGLAFLVVYNYFDYEPLILRYWTWTSVLASFFIVPIVALLLKFQIQNRFLELIGRASYHIFLTQMVYYHFMSEFVYWRVESRALEIGLNLVISVSVGIIFYLIETPSTNFAMKYMKKRIEVA